MFAKIIDRTSHIAHGGAIVGGRASAAAAPTEDLKLSDMRMLQSQVLTMRACDMCV